MNASVKPSFKDVQWRQFVSLGPVGCTIDKCIETLGLDDHELMGRHGTLRSDDPAHNMRLAESPAGPTLYLHTLYKDFDSFPKIVEAFGSIQAVNPLARLVVFTSEAVKSPCAFHVPSADFREFERKTARHLEMLMERQQPGGPLVPKKRPFADRHIELDHIDQVAALDEEGEFRLTVHLDGVPFELYCYLKPGNRRLTVLGQDAITRSLVTLPHFFRWRWLEDIPTSCIVLSDPTLYLADDLNGGWFIGTKERDYARECADIVKAIGKRMGTLPPSFFGVSAGGFSAISIASCIPGARAIVDIPQTDLTTYHVKAEIQKLVKAAFGCATVQDIPNELLHRVKLSERLRHQARMPTVHYLQNVQDRAHFDQFTSFVDDWMKLSHKLPKDRVGSLKLETYSRLSLSKGGHFPLRREEALKRVRTFVTSA